MTSLQNILGQDSLYFYDAAAPIVSRDSIDMSIAYWGDRYTQERGREESEEEEGEVVILKVDDTESEDEESYVSVDDEEVLNAVFDMFKEKFKDEFNFVD